MRKKALSASPIQHIDEDLKLLPNTSHGDTPGKQSFKKTSFITSARSRVHVGESPRPGSPFAFWVPEQLRHGIPPAALVTFQTPHR